MPYSQLHLLPEAYEERRKICYNAARKAASLRRWESINEDDLISISHDAILDAEQQMQQGRLRDNSKFKAWLYKIAYNKTMKLIDWMLNKDYVEITDAEGWIHNIGKEIPGLEFKRCQYDRFEQIDIINSMLSRLSPEQCSLLHFRFLEKMSYLQIAVRMDIPLESMKTKLRRAILELRKHAISHNLFSDKV